MSRMRSPGLASTALTTARRHSRSWPSESTSLVTSYFSATVSNIDATSTGFLSSCARVMRSSSHPRRVWVGSHRRPRERGGSRSAVELPPMSTLPAPEAPSPAAGPTVVVRTVPLEAADPLLAYLPADVPHDELLSWVRRGEGLVGWGSALTFEAHGDEPFPRGRGLVARDRPARRRARRGRPPGHGSRVLRLVPLRLGLRRGGPARRPLDDRRPSRRADVAHHGLTRTAADAAREALCRKRSRASS